MTRALVLVLCLPLAGCLLLAKEPQIGGGHGLCVDADCPGPYACDDYGGCATDCLYNSDCKSGYCCPADGNGCGGDTADLFSCVPK